jgi:hypothetical protein
MKCINFGLPVWLRRQKIGQLVKVLEGRIGKWTVLPTACSQRQVGILHSSQIEWTARSELQPEEHD